MPNMKGTYALLSFLVFNDKLGISDKI